MRGKNLITVIIAFLAVSMMMFLLSQIGSGQQKDKNKRYYNSSGREVVYIGYGTTNGGHARYRNSSGGQVVYIGAGKKSVGFASFHNTSGQQVAYIGSGTENYGFAKFYNNSGREVVYIGSSSTGSGMVEIDGKTVHDYAEVFELATRKEVIPGTVMSMEGNGVGLAPSIECYDPKVVGVICGAGGFTPGMCIGTRKDSSKDLPIAMSGQAYVRACLEMGPIKVGDLLVSSSKAGVAMRAEDQTRAFGTVIGKALEPYNGKPTESEGLLLMLVMNR